MTNRTRKTKKPNAKGVWAWNHCALWGRVALARSCMKSIINSGSASRFAKKRAIDVYALLEMLDTDLRTVRVTPDGELEYLNTPKENTDA